MLKTRIIPTLLLKNLGLVKGVKFDGWRRVGPVLPTVKVYNRRDVDELILVDITATIQSELPDFDTVKELAEECFVPLTVGGGIRDCDQIRKLLRSGADKICLNSVAYENANLVTEVASIFGSQCIVASIDSRRDDEGNHICFSHSGTVVTSFEPAEWAMRMQECGAGEILITSIDRDGTMKGYDLQLIERVASRVNLPVIASGGAGSYEHMRQAIQEAGASAVAAASMFHFTEQTPAGAKADLKRHGIPVRGSFTEIAA